MCCREICIHCFFLFSHRIVPRLVAWLVKRRYKIYLRVGHISLPYFVLRDVNITKNGFTLVSVRRDIAWIYREKYIQYRFIQENKYVQFQQIEEISVRSSLFSSDVAKLLAVIMRDVRINKDVPVDTTCKIKQSNELLDFRNKKIPPIIITFVQVSFTELYNLFFFFVCICVHVFLYL